MSDGRDWVHWNDPPCYWCNYKRDCRKAPARPKCQKRLAWDQENPEEAVLQNALETPRERTLYTYEEYGEIVDKEARLFYTACRLAAYLDPVEGRPRPLAEWDRMFDDFTAARRAELGL